MTRDLLILAVAAGALTVLTACDPTSEHAPADHEHSAMSDEEAAHAAEHARGDQLYQQHCGSCHGVRGAGDGPAARGLDPPPRNLTTGKLKFASVPAWTIPRDEDYLDLLEHGLTGTAMAPFTHLSIDDRRSLVRHVRRFASGGEHYACPMHPRVVSKGPASCNICGMPLEKEESAVGTPAKPVTIPPDPWSGKDSEAIAEGERIFHAGIRCINCHPAYVSLDVLDAHIKASLETCKPASEIGIARWSRCNMRWLEARRNRAGMYRALPTGAKWGDFVTAADFVLRPVKTGASRDRIARVVATGVGGTEMQGYADKLSGEELWAVVYYVESLTKLLGTPAADELKTALRAQAPPDGFETPRKAGPH